MRKARGTGEQKCVCTSSVWRVWKRSSRSMEAWDN